MTPNSTLVYRALVGTIAVVVVISSIRLSSGINWEGVQPFGALISFLIYHYQSPVLLSVICIALLKRSAMSIWFWLWYVYTLVLPIYLLPNSVTLGDVQLSGWALQAVVMVIVSAITVAFVYLYKRQEIGPRLTRRQEP